MKTYLELVNEAIREAKVTLDPLTSLNFNNPPRTIMYENFKTWVNRAYRELLISRNEWQFRTERASVPIWPRLHLAGLSDIPTIGELWVGVSSGVEFTIVDVHTFEDVENSADLEYTVSVMPVPGSRLSNLIYREDVIHINLPDKTGYLKGIGRYDFKSLVPGLQEIDVATVEVSTNPDPNNPEVGFSQNLQKVLYVPHEKWAVEYELSPWAEGPPRFITETSQGTYDFYPNPDHEYYISFDYTRKADLLTGANDQPLDIPEEYEDYLVWGAVLEYADYESNAKIFKRADKKMEYYRYLLERDYLEKPRIEGSRFVTD